MKNIPRIFVGNSVKSGDIVPINRDVSHYLTRVMRTNKCLAFGGGNEFYADLTSDEKSVHIGEKTEHVDPSNDITLYFAPIKRIDDLINMATQMGVRCFQPVVTERTVNHHVNWERMRKIAIEAAEQSNRNSIPEILAPIPFDAVKFSEICFADERFVYVNKTQEKIPEKIKSVFIGPEGGFSDAEFALMDAGGATGISLGKTILRAELAAVIAIEKIRK